MSIVVCENVTDKAEILNIFNNYKKNNNIANNSSTTTEEKNKLIFSFNKTMEGLNLLKHISNKKGIIAGKETTNANANTITNSTNKNLNCYLSIKDNLKGKSNNNNNNNNNANYNANNNDVNKTHIKNKSILTNTTKLSNNDGYNQLKNNLTKLSSVNISNSNTNKSTINVLGKLRTRDNNKKSSLIFDQTLTKDNNILITSLNKNNKPVALKKLNNSNDNDIKKKKLVINDSNYTNTGISDIPINNNKFTSVNKSQTKSSKNVSPIKLNKKESSIINNNPGFKSTINVIPRDLRNSVNIKDNNKLPGVRSIQRKVSFIDTSPTGESNLRNSTIRNTNTKSTVVIGKNKNISNSKNNLSPRHLPQGLNYLRNSVKESTLKSINNNKSTRPKSRTKSAKSNNSKKRPKSKSTRTSSPNINQTSLQGQSLPIIITENYNHQKEILQKYLKKSTPLRISQPYMDQNMFNLIYNSSDKEKEKWITKKGFDNRKIFYPPNFISNYVFTSEGKSLNDFRFREIEKKKWLDEKGFVYKNGKDLLLKIDDEEENQ